MYPEKLKPGDEVRIISPAESLSIIAEDQRKLAKERLESLGLHVTYSHYAEADDHFYSSSVNKRLDDLHEAFTDSKVKAILTTIGGYNSNQLLNSIDYNLIKNNPKIFCGFSDITILTNAFYKKTGLITYNGPHFSSFGMEKGIDYTFEYFRKMFTAKGDLHVLPADHWSDDSWYIDQENRTFHRNEGYKVIQPGSASGTSIGGNLCTWNLLQGTEYMPSLKNSIVFLEDDELTFPQTFDRDLQSLIHQPDFNQVKGLVIGKFQKKSGISLDTLTDIVTSKPELNEIPIIAEASFGHTTPRFTFPIGGEVSITAKENTADIIIHNR